LKSLPIEVIEEFNSIYDDENSNILNEIINYFERQDPGVEGVLSPSQMKLLMKSLPRVEMLCEAYFCFMLAVEAAVVSDYLHMNYAALESNVQMKRTDCFSFSDINIGYLTSVSALCKGIQAQFIPSWGLHLVNSRARVRIQIGQNRIGRG
jgi:hypothetical protein